MNRGIVLGCAIAGLAIGGGLWLAARSHRSITPATATTGTATAGQPNSTAPGTAGAERKIHATLYYVSDDGLSLVGVQREVPFGETVLDQARQIVAAQLAPAPDALVSAIPAATTLRGLYLTDRGDAFVDLSVEVRQQHTGGALDELFTVYSIVNALTTNLPAVARVQILIDGKEVDTLAGHVDLRHPLQKNLKWVRTEKSQT
jgi:spore germination protein GerM